MCNVLIIYRIDEGEKLNVRYKLVNNWILIKIIFVLFLFGRFVFDWFLMSIENDIR